MTKFVDSLGLKRLVQKIKRSVTYGEWLPVLEGDGKNSIVIGIGTATGEYSHAEGGGTASGNFSTAVGEQAGAEGDDSHAEGAYTMASGDHSHAEGEMTLASGDVSHAEGEETKAIGYASHAEGGFTEVSGDYAHAEGSSNYDDPSFIHIVGVGSDPIKKNASVIYVKRDSGNYPDPSDPKTGYQYLLGVGGYQGRNIAEGMKSVQEVIADLEKGVAATETMTVEEIREIMSA